MNESLEKEIIGIVLTSNDEFDVCVGLGVTIDAFSQDKSKLVWSTFVDFRARSVPLNVAILSQALPELTMWMAEAVIDVPSAQNLSYLVSLLLERSYRSALSRAMHNFSLELMRDKKVFQPREQINAKLDALYQAFRFSKTTEESSVILSEVFSKITDSIESNLLDVKNNKSRNISTGIKFLDRMTGGFCPGRVYILGARTGIGKTTLATQFAVQASKQDKWVLFCTNEMSDEEIGIKTLSAEAGVPSDIIGQGLANEYESDKIYKAIKTLHERKLMINMRVGRSIERIEAEVRKLHRQGKINFLVIDYVQQVKVESKNYGVNKAQELTYVTDKIKEIARYYNIAVLSLAQIIREVDKKQTTLNLSHLKDSGSLEQDADCVFLMYTEDQSGVEQHYIDVAKNRFGKKGPYRIDANLNINKFFDPEIKNT